MGRHRSRSPGASSSKRRSHHDEDERSSRKESKRRRSRSPSPRSSHRSSSKRETSLERRERKALKKSLKSNSGKVTAEFANAVSAYAEPEQALDLTGGSTFVWGKKQEKEKKAGVSVEEGRARDFARRVEAKDELAKLERRRGEREKEREERDKEDARLAAMNESEQMREWIAREDDFYLEQSKKRAEIRVKESRAKPIDFLALNLKWSVPNGQRVSTSVWDNEDDQGEGLDVDLEEPYAIFENISLEETEELEQDIRMYLSLEKDASNLEFWRSMLLVSASALESRRAQRRLGSAQYADQMKQNEAIKNEFARMLNGKTQEQLTLLQGQVQKKLASNEPIDVEYWENLLKELIVWKAKAKLKDMHEIVLQNRLEQLRRKQRDEAIAMQEELANTLPVVEEEEEDDLTKEIVEDEPEEEPELWSEVMEPPLLASLTNEDKELELIEPDFDRISLVVARKTVHATRFVSRKHRKQIKGGRDLDEGRTKDAMAEALYQAEVDRGMDEDEELFNMEAELSKQAYVWEDKYRPRKPRFFNKVMTGFEWNKYNQTHYDTDNPPPKVVTGYRMVLFYPDLIDKSKAPTFNIIKEPGNDDTCILQFKAGPPYEDIAFSIVNREWEYSHKRGFRSSFDRGVLQLAWTFKRFGCAITSMSDMLLPGNCLLGCLEQRMSEYYSVDAFLAENQKLPCTFLHDVPNLGHLEGTAERDLRQHTTLELPYWLGLSLAVLPDHEVLELALPKPFLSRVRNALQAHAKSVNLKALGGGPYFMSGVKLDQTISDDKLKAILHKAFKDRLPEVFDQAQHASSRPMMASQGAGGGGLSKASAGNQAAVDYQAEAFLEGMEDWEKELFQAAESAGKASQIWASQRSST